MLLKYKGILLFVRANKENDLFIKFLSNSDELITGIVYGGLSKKKRNIFQVGSYLNFEVHFKSNRPSSINAELSPPYISNIIDNKYKLHCLICIVNLINLSIIEGQKVKDIYKTIDEYLHLMFFKKKWLQEFCLFLLKLLKIIGYEIDYLSKNKKFFDLEFLEFTDEQNINTIKFPHNLLNNYTNSKLDLNEINQFFKIFEIIFTKNHLSNLNLQLPKQYHLFKNIIIERIKHSE